MRIFNLINEVYNNVSFFAVHIFNIVDLLYIFSYFLYNRCKCGNCSIELLQNAKECQCCVEIDACVEALTSDQVVSEVGFSPKCITLHSGFNQACLGVWSLRIAAQKYRKIDMTRYKQTGSEKR